MRARAVAALSVVSVLVASPAQADDEADAPRPISVPFLVHETGDVRLITTVADVLPVDPTRRSVALGAERLSIESPIVGTSVYGGASWVGASGVPPGVASGRKAIGGNVETWLRTVWSREGLAFGGAIGVFLPSADHASLAARDLALTASSVDVQELNHYRTLSVGLAPSLDMRVRTGALSLQIRQGLEYASEPGTLEDSRLHTLTTLSAAVRFGEISVAAEVKELYLLDSGVSDARRTAVVAQGGASWEMGRVVPEVQLFSTVGTTLSPALEQAYGIRLGMTWRFEPRLRVEESRR